MRIAFFCIASLLWMMGTVFAAPSSAELEKIQAQLQEEKKAQTQLKEKAQNIALEVSSVKKQMVKAAGQVQDNEETLSKLEVKLQELEDNKKLVENRLGDREIQNIHLMGALQKMAVYPPQAIFFAPQNPIDNLRSSLILQSTQEPLHATTDKLKQELNKLATLQAAIKAQASEIKLVALRLETERDKMEKLMQQKSILQSHFEFESIDAKKKAEALGKQAKSLEDLLEKLEDEKQKKMKKMADAAAKQKPILAVPTPSAVKGAFEKSLGSLPLPARGRIIQKYGDTTLGGGSAKGLTMETRPNAQIISPFDGTILFAGEFKGYGNLIIIEHSDNYHTLLSGLTRIDCAVGQNVLTGEPIGIMSNQKSNKLYLEFRKNGQPVNPQKWFASKI